MLRTAPIGLSRVRHLTGAPFRHAQLHKVLHSRSRLLPLFPDIHPDPPTKPAVPFLRGRLHACDSEVAKPSADEDLYILHHFADVSALTAGSQLFQLLLCFPQGLRVDADIYSVPSLPKRKAQKLKSFG